MALTLLVATYQNLPPSRPMSKAFGPSGGTIGRAPTNDLILPDPLQFVSRVQAKVEYRSGAYFLLDQGRNPVVVNGTPVGNGAERRLSDGDRLVIGDYGLVVEVEPSLTAPVHAPRVGAAPPSRSDELLDDLSEIHGSIRPVGESIDAFGINLGGGGLSRAEGRSDPMFDGSNQLLPSGTQSDHLPEINAPLPPARARLDSLIGGKSESSLLDDLDADASMPPLRGTPPAPGGMASGNSGARGAIPDDFNPFSRPGIRQSEPIRPPPQPAGSVNRMSAAPNGAAIPDDFDPFKPHAPPPPAEPVQPTPRRDAKPPARQQSHAAPSADDLSLFQGLEDVASDLPQPPAKTAPSKADVERAPIEPTESSADTAPIEKPAVAALRAAAAARGGLQVSSASSTEEVLAVAYARALSELMAGAGVPELTERMASTLQPLRRVGELLRMVIVGLQRVLEARRLTKHEMRVDMTMVHQRRNNPLKFSPDATEALTHLLTPRGGDAYLTPDEAIIEAFEDLQAHHLAVMAGMRAALQGVLRRYDPAQLERQLQASPLLDKVLPMTRKAKMWDLLTDLHNKILRESEDEFDRLFGQHFRAAYDEQIRRLRGMRKREPGGPG